MKTFIRHLHRSLPEVEGGHCRAEGLRAALKIRRGKTEKHRPERSFAPSSSDRRSGGTEPVNSVLAPGGWG